MVAMKVDFSHSRVTIFCIPILQAPKEFDILAIPLTASAVKMLRSRKGMPEEWRDYLSVPYSAP